MPMPIQTQNAVEQIDAPSLKDTALRAYRSQQQESDQHQRIVSYLPMVHKIVHQVVCYLRPALSIEDLVSAGTIGLVKAARDFDPSKDAEFKTYAYIRIRGAVIDELRNWSFVPPNLGKQMQHIDRFCRDMIDKTGSAPTDEQIAQHLGITVERLFKTFENARAGHFLSIHGLSEKSPTLGKFLVAEDTATPDARLERSELLEQLAAEIQKLPKKQRQITILYYNQQLTMKQIAKAMNITESRVSQLHAAAIVKLSVQLGAYNDA
jgi:RNA polymerase sigma factor for flagellar operon FliA